MEKLQHLNALYKVIDAKLLDSVKLPAKQLLAASHHDDLPHILLYGKSPHVIKKYTELFLQCYTGNQVDVRRTSMASFDGPKQSSVQYRSGNGFTEIDMDHADRHLLSELIKSIADHKGFCKKRHVIILNRIESMPEYMDNALRNILENFTKNTVFIAISNNASRIHETIKSRCMTINLNIDLDTIAREFLSTTNTPAYISYCSDRLARERFLALCDHDPINIAILCELDDPLYYNGHVFGFVDKWMKDMLMHFGSRQRTKFLEYNQKLREFVIKIGASCIPIRDVAKSLLAFTNTYFPDELWFVAKQVADMEHHVATINKHIFVLETYVDIIVRQLGASFSIAEINDNFARLEAKS